MDGGVRVEGRLDGEETDGVRGEGSVFVGAVEAVVFVGAGGGFHDGWVGYETSD